MRAIHTRIAEPDPYHHEAGKIDLWGPDSYHPSVYGAYLNALVVFEKVTGKDARSLGAGERPRPIWASRTSNSIRPDIRLPRLGL